MNGPPPRIPDLPDFLWHVQVWKILLGYTCTAIVIATGIIAVLALLGVVTLPKKQRDWLFFSLIGELVGAAVLFYAGAIRLDPVSQVTSLKIYSVRGGPSGCDTGLAEVLCAEGDIALAGGGTCGHCKGDARMEISGPVSKNGRQGWRIGCDENGNADYDGGEVVAMCLSQHIDGRTREQGP